MIKKRKDYIDLIRAFSVCLIVNYHFWGYTENFNFSGTVFTGYANGNWGNLGVFLFFMISGNVLMYKYENTFDLKEFILNRFLKILVPFWICYAAFFLLNFWQTKTFPNIPIHKFLFTILGMDGFFLYKTQTFYILGEWFLGSIILIYILFPLIRICVIKNINLTIAVLFILNCILYYNNCFGLFQIAVRRNLIVGLFYFILGIWIEQTVSKENKFHSISVFFIYLACILLLIFKLPLNEYLSCLIVTIGTYLFFMNLCKYVMKLPIVPKIIFLLSKNSYTIFLLHHVIIQKVIAHFSNAAFSFKGIFCVFTICILLIAVGVLCYNRFYNSCKKLLSSESFSGH